MPSVTTGAIDQATGKIIRAKPLLADDDCRARIESLLECRVKVILKSALLGLGAVSIMHVVTYDHAARADQLAPFVPARQPVTVLPAPTGKQAAPIARIPAILRGSSPAIVLLRTATVRA